MTDPFAAVQVPSTVASTNAPKPPVGTGTAVLDDPFRSAHDLADPFAVSSALRGEYTPSPSVEQMAGRLVVMIPRSFNPSAPDPNTPGKMRELYTVDLTILSGGKLEYPYRLKADPERGTIEEWKTWTVEDISPAKPATYTGYWVPQGGIIGGLKKSHAVGKVYMGVPTIVPTKDQRERGVTQAQVQAEYDSWNSRGRVTNRPRYGWTLLDPTADQHALAIQWWATAKDNISAIVPEKH
jgi:hypothetical protein